jgi:hypothetical protein
MGRTLTVFVLHCGDDLRHDPGRTATSVLNPESTTITLVQPGFRDLNSLYSYSDWKMFLFSDEWLSLDLVKALPLYLEQDTYNVISMFRFEQSTDEKEPKISISPRLFLSGVTLKDMSFQPMDVQSKVPILSYTNILDGFIFGKKP